LGDAAVWCLTVSERTLSPTFWKPTVSSSNINEKRSSMNDRYEIIEALARYARAIEERDGEALAALFAPEGEFQVFSRYAGEEYVALDADVVGQDALHAMLTNSAMPPGRGMHYLTTDHIVDIAGDEARMQAQFVVLASTANPRPENGWAPGAELMQGKLTLTMIGNYDSQLRRIGGSWVFTRHQVKHSLPMALPLKS
jgi:hypothetical protein